MRAITVTFVKRIGANKRPGRLSNFRTAIVSRVLIFASKVTKSCSKICKKLLKRCQFLSKVAQKLFSFRKITQKLQAMRLTRGHIQASNDNRYVDLFLQNQPGRHYVIKTHKQDIFPHLIWSRLTNSIYW